MRTHSLSFASAAISSVVFVPLQAKAQVARNIEFVCYQLNEDGFARTAGSPHLKEHEHDRIVVERIRELGGENPRMRLTREHLVPNPELSWIERYNRVGEPLVLPISVDKGWDYDKGFREISASLPGSGSLLISWGYATLPADDLPRTMEHLFTTIDIRSPDAPQFAIQSDLRVKAPLYAAGAYRYRQVSGEGRWLCL